jgi:peptidoglycan/xylan/chitin deacetylase (PgdA/CDA1 family)
MFKITTSWDDGDILDMRLTALLEKYGATGTFYITKEYRRQRLSDEQIRILAARHEVGAHTLTHLDLRGLSRKQKASEIMGSKQWLEEVTGNAVEMFCYPSGHWDDESCEAVKDAGFAGARTTEGGRIAIGDPFAMPVTLQVYPFPLRKKDTDHFYWRYLFQPLAQRGSDLHALGVPWPSMYSWSNTAKVAFDIARRRGGVFHLWGHSWEIEKYGMWEELEGFLKWASSVPETHFATNKEAVAYWKKNGSY